MNTENFIIKAKLIHGNKYDYSLTNYINSYIKVKIICPEHGIFEQLPTGHIGNKGCIKCSIKNKTMTNEVFIKRAIDIHGEKFDYSLTNYINSYTKVKIICKVHGCFEQNPNSHLRGQSCRKCADVNNALTTELFISKSNIIHNNKYDYSLVNYINNISNVKIICPDHGCFDQKPSNHLSGNGCNKCSLDIVRNIKYIEECKIKFDNKYDYSLVKYINNKTKVDIVCPEHGIFQQTMKNHLKYNGCPYCSGKRMNTNLYIKNCSLIHNNLYDYSKTKYTVASNYVTIICRSHGEFNQIAYTHAQGAGCPICKSSKGEREIISILNDLGIFYIHQKKFDGCIYISDLIFDFYIPKLNLCIEYNGLQHYESVDYFGGVDGLDIRKKRDSIKKEYCKENKIKLLIIKYDDNISKKLNKLCQ